MLQLNPACVDAVILPPCPGPLIWPSASSHTSHWPNVRTSASLPAAVTCDRNPAGVKTARTKVRPRTNGAPVRHGVATSDQRCPGARRACAWLAIWLDRPATFLTDLHVLVVVGGGGECDDVWKVGCTLGKRVGAFVGDNVGGGVGGAVGVGVGERVGEAVGRTVGVADGCKLGVCVGVREGANDGLSVVGGFVVGWSVDRAVGCIVGAWVGVDVGPLVGAADRPWDGEAMGAVGRTLGFTCVGAAGAGANVELAAAG